MSNNYDDRLISHISGEIMEIQGIIIGISKLLEVEEEKIMADIIKTTGWDVSKIIKFMKG